MAEAEFHERKSSHYWCPVHLHVLLRQCVLWCLPIMYNVVTGCSSVQFQALTGVIQRSTAQTVMGLDAELQGAAAALQVGRTVVAAAASTSRQHALHILCIL
jgi:hypothetical protein